MDIKLLKTAIKQNNIPKFLIFIANEPTLCRQYLDSMSNTLNKYHKFYNSADEVIYDATTNTREDFLYVILNDDKILKNPTYINELIKLDRNIVVYFNEFDTKNQIYKDYKDYFVNFKKLDKYTIVAYLMKKLDNAKIDVDQDKIETLVDYCNCNLGCCLNELDKIITLDQAKSNLVFDYMLNNGFSDYRETNLFSFISKIINKDKSVFDDELRLDESIISITTNLYKQLQNKLDKLVNKSLELNYAKALQLCADIDNRIKDGTISDKYALDYLLLELYYAN